ncbi:MAG TPA: alpha/beta hydrolase, partial [Pseudonocardiaceae bacterium]
RSAAQPAMAELGRDLERAAARPGLAILPLADPFGSADGGRLSRRAADRAGAGIAELAGLGHWWMLQDPKAGAEAINAFLASVTG